VGNHYEVTNGVVTKYYFAGGQRIAMRKNGTLSYLLGDHLGSSSVTTNASGVKTASALYKAFGETRYSSGNLGTDYKFTGQREESALGGIYWFQSRWFDPTLGRFMSPDTIVPTQTQGTQAWDRYAFVNNNPVRYNDPSGHMVTQDDGGTKKSYEQTQYDRQRIAHEQCEAGIESYCSYGEQHPVETFGFGLTALIAAPLVEAFVLEGGAAATVDSLYNALVAWLANYFSHNLDSLNVSLGNWAEGSGYTAVGENYGMTYLSTGSGTWGQMAYNFLNNVGMWNDINKAFTTGQADQAKTFFVTQIGPKLGPGTLNEIGWLAERGYASIPSIWSSFVNILVP